MSDAQSTTLPSNTISTPLLASTVNATAMVSVSPPTIRTWFRYLFADVGPVSIVVYCSCCHGENNLFPVIICICMYECI